MGKKKRKKKQIEKIVLWTAIINLIATILLVINNIIELLG